MHFLYTLVIQIYFTGIRFAALFGNDKAKKWIQGRKNWETIVKQTLNNTKRKRIWFHCASLGEFEQGRPLIEAIKQRDPSVFVVLSFFSPSGFEIRKNYSFADCICYLPTDNKSNAKIFLDLIAPDFIVFIKYEFWFHYFQEIKKQKIPFYIISALFRSDQIFFKWYGSFFRSMLHAVSFFFLQDENSSQLLNQLNIKNYLISGDTRFDRVHQIVNENKSVELFDTICKRRIVVVAGSTWPEDETMLFKSLEGVDLNDLLIVIAPHEVNDKRVNELLKMASNFFTEKEIARYSNINIHSKIKLLVVDNIGLLSTLYQYATIAWVGGGFGKGIHNILEAAAYGKPVLFGPNYKKFKEAIDLVKLGGAFVVRESLEGKQIIISLLSGKENLKEASAKCLYYVKENLGATEKIISQIEKQINI